MCFPRSLFLPLVCLIESHLRSLSARAHYFCRLASEGRWNERVRLGPFQAALQVLAAASASFVRPHLLIPLQTLSNLACHPKSSRPTSLHQCQLLLFDGASIVRLSRDLHDRVTTLWHCPVSMPAHTLVSAGNFRGVICSVSC